MTTLANKKRSGRTPATKQHKNRLWWIIFACVTGVIAVALGVTMYFVLRPEKVAEDDTQADGDEKDNERDDNAADGGSSLVPDTQADGGGGNGTTGSGGTQSEDVFTPSELWDKGYGSKESPVARSGNLIAAGSKHVVMYLFRTKQLLAFGVNTYGQLGTGNTTSVDIKTKSPAIVKLNIPDDVTVTQIACGETHTMVLLSNGELYAFGQGTDARLGFNDLRHRYTPAKVMDLVSYVSAGPKVTFMVSDGKLYACGYNDGNFGTGTLASQRVYRMEINIQSLKVTEIKQISSGSNITIILLKNGTVYGSGKPHPKQLVGLTTTFSQITNLPRTGSQPIQIVSGASHTSILLANGEIWSFGDNSYYQFGNGTIVSSNVWVQAQNSTGMYRLFEIRNTHMLAYNGEEEVVYSWGSNNTFQQLGLSGIRAYPAQTLQNVSEHTVLAGGDFFSVCLTDRDAYYVAGTLY